MEYRKIKNIDGDYLVSDNGDVLNQSTDKLIGCIGVDGYVHALLKINGKIKNIRIHQLVWRAFVNEEYDGKSNVIDHINGNKKDNRLSNLREISFRENCVKDIKLGDSGILGVSWDSSKNRWRAQISIKDKRIHLGYRKTIQEASKLYNEALKKYNIA